MNERKRVDVRECKKVESGGERVRKGAKCEKIGVT